MRKFILLVIAFSFMALIPKVSSAFTLIQIPQFCPILDPSNIVGTTVYEDVALTGSYMKSSGAYEIEFEDGTGVKRTLEVSECNIPQFASGAGILANMNGQKKVHLLEIELLNGEKVLGGFSMGDRNVEIPAYQ
jgi:hypothetical protein